MTPREEMAAFMEQKLRASSGPEHDATHIVLAAPDARDFLSAAFTKEDADGVVDSAVNDPGKVLIYEHEDQYYRVGWMAVNGHTDIHIAWFGFPALLKAVEALKEAADRRLQRQVMAHAMSVLMPIGACGASGYHYGKKGKAAAIDAVSPRATAARTAGRRRSWRRSK
jgi:hypothetical protein